mgnify:CR=1 FL=1
MSNDYFRFRQFTIHQDRCAMKVGMDGVTVGAWAASGFSVDEEINILDIGTGSGLIALMMAQRFPLAHITAIDIDEPAITQAADNIRQTPFSSRIEVIQTSLQEYQTTCDKKFNIIVSNPPYFTDSLKAPDSHRTTARHTDTLSYRDLMHATYGLLSENGNFTIIIPSESLNSINEEAIFAGLHPYMQCAVHTVGGKVAKRYMLSFRKEYIKDILFTDLYLDSEEYKSLTKDFYMH